MTKILNKFLLLLKNLLLIVALLVTIYIIAFSYRNLEKSISDNLFEFISIILPFILLLIVNGINIFFKQKEVNDNLFYNITSFMVMLTILVFCLRSLFDQNMYLWHKNDYKINFNYFSDQLTAIKFLLYGLSFSNIILMINNKISKNMN